jgi:hypothetical protein
MLSESLVVLVDSVQMFSGIDCSIWKFEVIRFSLCCSGHC